VAAVGGTIAAAAAAEEAEEEEAGTTADGTIRGDASVVAAVEATDSAGTVPLTVTTAKVIAGPAVMVEANTVEAAGAAREAGTKEDMTIAEVVVVVAAAAAAGGRDSELNFNCSP